MPSYHHLHAADHFNERLVPALAACLRQRSFSACRDLCRDLLPRAEAFDLAHHITPGETLIGQVALGLPFERTLWRALAAELLLYAAVESPELSLCTETWTLFEGRTIAEAVGGARRLTIGPVVHRPDHCGWSDADDVARLADELRAVDPSTWRVEDLPTEDDREDELETAREWFPALVDLHRRARETGCVIVHEFL